MLKTNLFLKYSYIIIWQKPNGVLYFKKYKGYFGKYEVGQLNTFGHKVLLVISLTDVFYTMPLKERLITKIISFLERLK